MVVPKIKDKNNNHMIESEEWNTWKKENPIVPKDTMVEIVDSAGNVIAQAKLGDIENGATKGGFALVGDVLDPQDANKKKLDGIQNSMAKLLEQIKLAEQSGQTALVQQLKENLKKQIAEAEKYNALVKKPIDLSTYKKAAGMGAEKGSSGMKAQMTSGGAGAGASGGAGGAKATTIGGGTTGQASYPPAGWGAQTYSGPAFNTSAYMNAMAMEDNIMSSWDSINDSSKRGKQLMMLFFYFARMAESGDMGAMYQFMKFITYIISKDKAKQQIEMGQKLIQLQDLSRKWTEKLLNVQTSSTDSNTSNELMKTMTIVKSETDAIATSQKLISQMMEEFAQVVETLTNTTKSALETTGRILRTVSTIR